MLCRIALAFTTARGLGPSDLEAAPSIGAGPDDRMPDEPLGPAGLRGKPAGESVSAENIAARAILADSPMAFFAISKTFRAAR